eukprot:CAMPEP_0183313278 /NCGR_PEP_ID=MMETSP0160_2-20130417/44739_1 /TAXON_ID=2839 ORGANISM="Odontella Sinensis, Strain Grunow 1884" /NCGR_SAMPLE_ID=MMETSP0160_2 /ASSEMBLY_ACC=CAM_ASM_000250 /LENGTH=84 /DNA_ID=CAMNT_0025478323 /DNA_START=72 /DNA_END=323 /DNA_ORIENTATION=-
MFLPHAFVFVLVLLLRPHGPAVLQVRPALLSVVCNAVGAALHPQPEAANSRQAQLQTLLGTFRIGEEGQLRADGRQFVWWSWYP